MTISDHTGGIDDLKAIGYEMSKNNKKIEAYMNDETASTLLKRYSYIFSKEETACIPYIEAKKFKNNDTFYINDLSIQTFEQDHKYINTTGFKIGGLAYSTDVKFLPEKSFEILKDTEVWIVDCLSYEESFTHSHLEMTLQWIKRVNPKKAILTHMSHNIDYNEISKILPPNVEAAFDGMTIVVL